MNAVLFAVTGVSLLLAGFMSAIAWRMTREERRRSDARVAALSSGIYEDVENENASLLFHEQATPASSRYAIAAVLGACVVAAVAGLAIVSVRHAQRQAAHVSDTRSLPEVPLELLELEHERDGEQLVPAVRLGPGATTPFVVSVAGAADVDRFRLSFRTGARVEPHVDRRAS